MDFSADYVLENDRALLRPMKHEDIEFLLPFALQEPTLWQYSLQSANSEENMKAYIASAMNKKLAKDSFPFIVYDKKDNTVAGSTRFYDFQELHNTVQLGYTWYGKRFWGTGLNKNCKFLMLQFAFETLNLDRVEFRADNNNKRSIAAMKSLGCTVEGVLRSNCAAETGRRDSIILSILQEEWSKGIKDSLAAKIKGLS